LGSKGTTDSTGQCAGGVLPLSIRRRKPSKWETLVKFRELTFAAYKVLRSNLSFVQS